MSVPTTPAVAEFWLELPGDKIFWLKGRCAIGREADNELVLNARALSRHHALLTPAGGAYEIRDLDSSNGTHVNRARLQRSQVLRDGDEIQLGELLLRYRCTRALPGEDEVQAKTTQLLDRVHSRACWLVLAEIEHYATHCETAGLAPGVQHLQDWIAALRLLIEKNGGTIHCYAGEMIFAHWPCDLAAPEQVLAALRGLEELRGSTPLSFRLLLHHGHVLFDRTQGGDVGGDDIAFVLQATKATKRFRARALLSQSAVRTLQLEGRCDSVGTATVDRASGLVAFFGLPRDLAGKAVGGQARRILLIEESSVVSDAFIRLIEGEAGFVVCGRAQHGPAARKLHAAHRPDLVIVDVSLRTSDTLALIGDLLQADPQTRVLVLTALADLGYIERALRAGALGYVLRSDPTETVLDAIRVVSEGSLFLSRQIAGAALKRIGVANVGNVGSTPRSGPSALSDRELDVFRLIGLGQPNREIARALGISVKTVEAHRENIKVKLNVNSAAELAAAAKTWAESGGRGGA